MSDQSIKIPEYTYDKLKRIKKETGISIRFIVMKAIDKLEKEYGKKSTK